MRSIILCGVLAIAPITCAIAQDSIPPGTRVRLTAPAHFKSWKEGLVQPDASIRVPRGPRADSLLVPLADVTRLERFVGRSRSWPSGALYGGVLGLLGGAVLTGIACANDYCPSGGGAVGVLGVSVVFGGWLGASIGAFFSHDTWQEVPLDQIKVGARPPREGVGFGVSIVF